MTIDYRPALPYILLEKNDASSYTFDPFTPTYNFSLQDLRFTPPKDLMGGEFEMTVMGSGATNAQANTILSNISEGNTVTIYVGKTNAGKVKLFYGVIETIEVKEDNKNTMQIVLSGPDWGSNLLKHRIVSDSWIQKKDTADQTRPDETDDNVLIRNIVKNMLDDSSGSYPDKLYPCKLTDFGVVYSTSYCQPPEIRLSQFEANFERIDDKLAELDEIGNTIHFIDPDKNFVMRDREYFLESGILFIDDHTSSIATSWPDQTKLGYIGMGSIYKKTVEGHRRRLFGLGAGKIKIDQQSTNVTSSTDMGGTWIAQRFTPTYGSCYNIGLYLKGATSTVDLTLYLAEEIAGKPGGTLRAVNVSKNVVTSAGSWLYFPMDEVLTIGQNYWIILSKSTAAGDDVAWHHNNTDFGASTQLATSSDGITWALETSNRYTYSFIQYSNDALLVIYPAGSLVTQKHFWEDIIHRSDINDDGVMKTYIVGLYNDTARRKETFTCNIRCPDVIPQIGHRVRVVKTSSGYTIDSAGTDAQYYTIRGITYIFESSDDKQTGTYHFKVELVKMSVFT